jgi:hypothetical protein
VLVARFVTHLKDTAPALANSPAVAGQAGLNALGSLPPEVSHQAFLALTSAFSDIFFYASPVMAVAFIVALFLKEIPLRTSVREVLEHEPVGM